MSNEQLKDRRTTGLYGKFIVTRTDGKSEPGQKHDGCDYFVLDLTHDPFALHALDAYARWCQQEYPQLARDLRNKLDYLGFATVPDVRQPPR